MYEYMCALKAFDKILTFICSKLFTTINFTTMIRDFCESRVAAGAAAVAVAAAATAAALKLYILRILIIHDPHFSKENNTLSIVELFYRRQTVSLISAG